MKSRALSDLRPLIAAAALIWISLGPMVAKADVTLMNGNFYIGYTDITVTEQFEVQRVYNSKSGFKGMFGWGWGCAFESYLTVNGDGSVTAHEYGGGAEYVFRPPGMGAEAAGAVADAILGVEVEEGKHPTEAGRIARRQKLATDERERGNAWERLAREGKVAARSVPVGTKLRSTRFGEQHLVKMPSGYHRHVGVGKVEWYDASGYLISIRQSAVSFLNIRRDETGRILQISDEHGQTVSFTYNTDGRVTRLRSGEKVSYYSYGGDALVASQDVDGNSFGYRYDDIYNLTEIRYADNTSERIYYLPRSQNDSVRVVHHRDGSATWYEYDWSENPDRRTTVIQQRGPSGEDWGEQSYEWLYVVHEGRRVQKRYVYVSDGVEQVTEYDLECGIPTLQARTPGSKALFRYDEHCNVTFKDDGQTITELSYWQGKKVSQVRRKRSGSSDEPEVVDYQYSALGDLVYARSSTGYEVNLEYDKRRRISVLKSPDSTIRFDYNDRDKPVVITVDRVGKLVVSYDENGQLLSSDVQGGKARLEVAGQISSSLDRLMNLVAPAGVRLSL